MGDAFGPRPCASRRATMLCLALSASVAIAGCQRAPRTGECVNAATGEVVRMDDRTGFWTYVTDKRGYQFAIKGSDQTWRCKELRP